MHSYRKDLRVLKKKGELEELFPARKAKLAKSRFLFFLTLCLLSFWFVGILYFQVIVFSTCRRPLQVVNISNSTLLGHKTASWMQLGSASWRRWRSPSVFFLLVFFGRFYCRLRWPLRHTCIVWEASRNICEMTRRLVLCPERPSFQKPRTWFRSDNGRSHDGPLWTRSSVPMICRQPRLCLWFQNRLIE